MNRDKSITETKRPGRAKKRTTPPKEGFGEFVSPRNSKFKPLTNGQKSLFSSIKANTLTFAAGPPGTGKSYCSIAAGCEMLDSSLIQCIVCVKPFTEIDSELGTLPGDKDEKLAVLYNPMRQIFIKMIGKSHYENLIRAEKIIYEPLGSILGMTYDNALIIMDEAQHSTPSQMKVLLTRLGKDSKAVVCGDYREQKFTDGLSGMEDALNRLGNKSSVGVVQFQVDDIVRSDFTKEVILAYRENEND